MRRRAFLGGSAIILCTPLFPQDAVAEQPKKLPVIGFLSGASPGQGAPNVAAFREGLRETGWVEGHNVSIEYRWSEGRPGRLPGLADDLVARNVDVIVVTGDAATLAAKNATATIPIVFFSGGDPVATGLVTSLARPGNNLTGLGIMVVELMAKRFELLAELVPHARMIALLINPKDPNADRFSRELEGAARAKGLELKILGVSSDSEIDGVFASLVQLHVDGVVVALFREREQLVALAARHAVPAIYPQREFVDAGGLISYGSSVTAAVRQLGVYAGNILNGAKPADLPVQQPTTFELVVNLKTAKALGITVPPSILVRADEVIE